MKATELDGKTVRFKGDHPHAGETGIIQGAEHTPIGWGLVVKLNNCIHGTESCFLFKPKDADVLN